MRTHHANFLGCRLALAVALMLLATAPEVVRGQGGLAPPEFNAFPSPFGGPRFRQDGTGPFFAFEMLYLEQTIPLESQSVAVRGFIDIDGSITGSGPGSFVGSGAEALNVRQLKGPDSFQPGLAMTAGWRFESGSMLEVGWWHLADTRYSATASVIPDGFALDSVLANTFVTSFNVNFATDFAGPIQNVLLGNPGATFGIWNAATEMQIDFVQRFDKGHMKLRIPIDQGDNHRVYGSVGGQAIILWERFKWRAIGRNLAGQAGPTDVAIYSNVVSNRLYGATAGLMYDWFMGTSPLGGFAVTCEVQGSLAIDIVKERAKYELGDFSTASSRAINEITLAPVGQADVSLWWFPYEAMQFRLGWNVMGMFNTVAAPHPIDFNVSAVSPNWERRQIRFINGLRVGFGVVW